MLRTSQLAPCHVRLASLLHNCPSCLPNVALHFDSLQWAQLFGGRWQCATCPGLVSQSEKTPLHLALKALATFAAPILAMYAEHPFRLQPVPNYKSDTFWERRQPDISSFSDKTGPLSLFWLLYNSPTIIIRPIFLDFSTLPVLLFHD
jgi:hypothetical protein